MRELRFGKQAVLFYTVVALLAMTVAAHADTINFTVANTGVPAGTGSTRDANYLYYSVTSDPSVSPGVLQNGVNGVKPAYIMDTTAWPIYQGPYNKNTGAGKWIGPEPQHANGGLTAPPN